MPLSAGDQLGPYVVTAPIGAGGMGEVYKARDTRLERTVAIKVLPEHIAKREDLRARFEREARAVASLNHPNICTLHDIGTQDGVGGYMVMELIEGEPLAARIEKGAIPLDQALQFATQIADALDRAHRAGVTHRDVKPQNIMLTRDGVKVLDFGLAKSQAKPGPTEATLTNVLTTEGTVMGTPQYMAPEQFEGKEADARSDIWAFGAVLYEMVTGRKAFQGSSYSSLVGAILATEPAPMAVRPFTPAWLERLVRRCLAKDPEDRWQSMRDVVIELRMPPPETAGGGAPTTARGALRSWLPWAVATVAVGVLIPSLWLRKPAPEADAMRLEIVLPPGMSIGPAGRGQLAVSPATSMIVLSARDREGKLQLFLRNLKSGSTIPLPGTENGTLPFWSPDSSEIAFVAEGRLKRLELTGNRVVDICAVADALGGIWRDDGVILIDTASHILHKVPASGGNLTPLPSAAKLSGWFPASIKGSNAFLYGLPEQKKTALMTPEGDVRQYLPSDSDATAVASYVPNPAGGGWLLYGKQGGRLAARGFDVNTATFQGDETILADTVRDWSASNTGLLAYRRTDWGDDRILRWIDRNGTRGAAVGEPGNVFNPRLSPDNRVVAFTRRQGGRPFVYTYDLIRQTATRLDAWNAFWFGKSMVYDTGDGWVQQGLFEAEGKKILGKKEDRITAPAASPDGKWLVYTKLAAGAMRLVLFSVETGQETQLGPEMKFQAHHGSFSPDGRWLMYTALVQGRWDVFVRPAPSTVGGLTNISAAEPSRAIQISSAGGVQPVWRADGKEIFYLAPSGRMMAVPVSVGEGTVRPGAPVGLFPTSLGMYIGYQNEYDVSADGKRFLMPVPVFDMQVETPISVIVNWPRLLAKNNVP